jgi:hypothetical protein
VRDRILRASLNAIPAEDATAIIDVIDLSISFIDADSFRWRSRIVTRDDVDTIRRTGSCAQITCNTLLSSILVNVKEMLTTIARLNRYRFIRILDGPFAFGDVG